MLQKLLVAYAADTDAPKDETENTKDSTLVDLGEFRRQKREGGAA